MNESTLGAKVDEHYGLVGLCERILEALARDGKNLECLMPNDLSLVDQFHIGGIDATLSFAAWSELESGSRVLDVGCGIGGPARTLATRFGCWVAGVDITKEYCQTARRLTAMLDLSDRVEFASGDAVELPYDDHGFDVVWAQHVAMNIQDKSGYFREVRRVLRDSGRFLFYEVVAGAKAPIYFPVPWAGSSEISFLIAFAEWRELLSKAGLRLLRWEDVSASAIGWFEQRMAERENPDFIVPEARLQLLFGRDADEKFSNVFRNLREERIAVVRGCAEVW